MEINLRTKWPRLVFVVGFGLGVSATSAQSNLPPWLPTFSTVLNQTYVRVVEEPQIQRRIVNEGGMTACGLMVEAGPQFEETAKLVQQRALHHLRENPGYSRLDAAQASAVLMAVDLALVGSRAFAGEGIKRALVVDGDLRLAFCVATKRGLSENPRR